jgi:hypothetical protein
MFTKPTTQLIQWQDLKVRSEVDMVFEMAHQKGWKDCEIFGHGEMITSPMESKGWKLIPADLYEYSIPAKGVVRVLQTIQAGVQIKGIIIADDQRRADPTSAAPQVSMPSPKTNPSPKVEDVILPIRLRFDQVAKAVYPVIIKVFRKIGEGVVKKVAIFIGKVLLGLIYVAGFIMISPFLLLGKVFSSISGYSSSEDYDPKLVILVDDGDGGTVWVSLLTWYD